LTVSDLTAALGRQQIGRQEMGRALGRVAAHEIGHVLLALPNHQRSGLMRESFQAIDMVVPVRLQYTLSAMEIARLRHRSNWIVATRSHAGSPDVKDELPYARQRQDAPEDVGKATDRTKR
jgi:hypothetical protein